MVKTYLLILVGFCICHRLQSQSWEETLISKSGELQCVWFDSKPFIYPEGDQIKGIEYELINDFVSFINDQYEINVTIDWKRTRSFSEVYNYVKDSAASNAFGMSAFSITPARKASVQFSRPYMPDISVIISNNNLPIAKSVAEFDSIFNGKTAVTIRNTTFEDQLIGLSQRGIKFNLQYILSSGDIIDSVVRHSEAFGYIDLPSYILALKNITGIKRQYLFSFKNEGLAFIIPKGSDWIIPVNTYLKSPQFEESIDKILTAHFDEGVPELIEQIAEGAEISTKEEVFLLTQEKEIQAKELLDSALQIQRQSWIRNILIIGLSVIAIFSVILYRQYKLKAKSNRLLNDQKKTTELRNEQLVKLNEEKNNLINILAHDLRAPINQIEGLARIFQHEGNTSSEQDEIIQKIILSTTRLNNMIGKILDVESIDTEQENLTLERLKVAPLLKTVVRNFHELAINKNIVIEEEIACKDCMVVADEIFLMQIFENLLSNALKFSPPERKVLVRAHRSNGNIKITFKDEGPGISDSDKTKLFNKFQRLSAQPTKGEPSVGLGLSIVKKYTELMKGRVYCESEVGKGASFIIELKSA